MPTGRPLTHDMGSLTTPCSSFWSSTIPVRAPSRVCHQRSTSKEEPLVGRTMTLMARPSIARRTELVRHAMIEFKAGTITPGSVCYSDQARTIFRPSKVPPRAVIAGRSYQSEFPMRSGRRGKDIDFINAALEVEGPWGSGALRNIHVETRVELSSRNGSEKNAVVKNAININIESLSGRIVTGNVIPGVCRQHGRAIPLNAVRTV